MLRTDLCVQNLHTYCNLLMIVIICIAEVLFVTAFRKEFTDSSVLSEDTDQPSHNDQV